MTPNPNYPPKISEEPERKGFKERERFKERKGFADAALAASIFHYGEYSIRTVKQYLKGEGVPVRL